MSRIYPLDTPRPYQDPSMRFKKHGPILPLEEKRSFLERLFGIVR